MLDGPEMLDVLSCNHCVWKPKVIECLPLVHCRLSTRVKAFGTTLCVASDAPFSVHGDCPAGNAVVAANAEPGKLSDDCPDVRTCAIWSEIVSRSCHRLGEARESIDNLIDNVRC